MTETALPASAETRLRKLFWLRNVSIAGLVMAGLAAVSLGIDLPLPPLVLTVLLLAGVNVFTAWRLRQVAAARDLEILWQLAMDVSALTAVLYWTGGATNPFVSLYLLPLTIAATVLPMRHTVAMALLTVAAYSVLLAWYRPIGQIDTHSDAFGLHVLGMWFNFLVSAALITFFVTRMSESLRSRDAELAAAREKALRDQQLVLLGTFAAGTAHELSTPLSTMAVVVNDLERERSADSDLVAELRVLREQVQVCKKTLTELVGRAGRARAESARRIGLNNLLEEACSRWRLLRPESRLKVQVAGSGNMPSVAAEETMVQALVSLLNNAADASPEEVELFCNWSDGEITLEIRDHGPGVSDKARLVAGRLPYTEKPGHGLGLGLLLANATIERLGGRIDLRNRAEGGAATRVRLPITVGAVA